MNKGVANGAAAAAAGQGGFSSLITTFSFALTRLVPLLHCNYTRCLKFLEKSHFFHTILKVKFLSKNSILTKPQHFYEIFAQNFF